MGFTEDNKAQLDRMRSLLAALDSSSWDKDIGGGWTVGTMICHLGFWDRMTSARILAWRSHGRLTSVPDADNVEAINDSVRFLSQGVDLAHGTRLAIQAASEIDAIAASLSPKELSDLESSGRDRWFKRSLHRQGHLERLEQALR